MLWKGNDEWYLLLRRSQCRSLLWCSGNDMEARCSEWHGRGDLEHAAVSMGLEILAWSYLAKEGRAAPGQDLLIREQQEPRHLRGLQRMWGRAAVDSVWSPEMKFHFCFPWIMVNLPNSLNPSLHVTPSHLWCRNRTCSVYFIRVTQHVVIGGFVPWSFCFCV